MPQPVKEYIEKHRLFVSDTKIQFRIGTNYCNYFDMVGFFTFGEEKYFTIEGPKINILIEKKRENDLLV